MPATTTALFRIRLPRSLHVETRVSPSAVLHFSRGVICGIASTNCVMANADTDPYEFHGSGSGSDSEGESLFGGFGGEHRRPEFNRANFLADQELNYSDIEVSSDESDWEENEADAGLFQPEPNPNWASQNYLPFDVPIFTSPSGPAFPGNFDCTTANELEFLQLFLHNDVLDTIVENTNKYAAWKIAREDLSELRVWPKPLDLPELKAFLAINIVMGLNPVPSYKNMWDESPFLGNAGVKSIMSKTRYEQICRFIHVGDRESELPRANPDHDPLAKVRPLISELDRLFPKYFRPTENQTIDEGMVKFKGRCAYVQYMKDKPIKRGLKVFLRNNSDSGYLQQFEIYLGKRGTERKSIHGIYFDIINRLTFRLRGRNHRIWFDNLYTSVPVLLHLQKHGLWGCGTVRSNRKYLPDESRCSRDKEPRGWTKVWQDRSNPFLTVSVWRDTKTVRFLSMLSQPQLRPVCMRRVGGTHIRLTQPHAADQYNQNMAGTDKFDQKRQVYPVGRPAKKMWKYLFWFFVNSSIVNAWILFEQCSRLTRPKNYSQFDFRHELVNLLTKDFSGRKRPAARPVAMPQGDHANVNLNLKRPRRCKLHQTYFGEKKETSFGCRTCGHSLCLPCHTRLHNIT